ncbi:MAG: response regulator transcription factor [Chitinophagales bacterium]|nr:response regulator transcription factor [Chitinophagales bacterium]
MEKLNKNQSPFKILMVDKDKASAEHNVARFKNAPYDFIIQHKVEEVMALVKKIKFDLIILEVELNKVDGIELCYEIKNDIIFNKNTPVIFLAEKHDDYTQLAAFDAGCDDFIPKEYKSRLIIAKVKAFLNRLYTTSNVEIGIKKFGHLEIDEEQVMVYKKGEPLKLSKKEFQLIMLLTSKPGKVFRRNFILAKIWGDDIIVGDRNIDTHIKKIRKKIGKDRIETVRGIGYKFIEPKPKEADIDKKEATSKQ